MAPRNISPQLLDKYLNNLCTDEERELVEAWYASLRGKSEYLDSLPAEKQVRLKDETFNNIQDRLEIDNEPIVRKFPLRCITWLAASVLLVLGIYFTYHDNSQPKIALVKENRNQVTPNNIHFVNTQQRVVKHQLPDKSTVWMHPDAAITYPAAFDSDKRMVTFSGEGFFDITKDKSRPFSIQSGALVIRVLGTSFNVKAPAKQKVFQVSVVTGRVEVSAPDNAKKPQLVILQPKQQATFETGSMRLVSSVVPVQLRKEMYEPVTIVFKETPIKNAIGQLEKRFNIKIMLANPGIASCKINADFEQESLPAIMEMLCASLEASYKMSGKTITIDALPCQ